MIWIRRTLIALAALFGALALTVAFVPSFHSLKTFIVAALATMTAPEMPEFDASQYPKPVRVVKGESSDLYGGRLETWAGLDAQGNVLEAGVTVPMASIEKSPVMDHLEMSHEERMDRRRLRMPAAARGQTILDNVDLYYAPMGHEPERWEHAHFDFHFFSITPEAVQKIDCADLTVIDQSRLPRGYQEGIPPFAQARDLCVPQMGIHAISFAEFTGRKGPFEADLLIPHYAGQPVSLEPMIAREKLLKRQSFGGLLPEITYWPGGKRVPSFFQARFDAAHDRYDLVFGGFRALETLPLAN